MRSFTSTGLRTKLFAAAIAGSALVLAASVANAQPAGEDKPPEAKPAEPAGGDAGAPTDGSLPDDGSGGPSAEGTPEGGAPPVPDGATPADGTVPTTAPDPGAAAGTGTPVNLRLRRLQQKVQGLKERAWRLKARVGMLKDAVLGGGVGANVAIVHKNRMGGSYRLIKLVYRMDGTQIFARGDTTGSKTIDQKSLDILTGPVAPGSHTLSVLAVYRGHGYGVFKYLNKYRFRVRASHTFTAAEGRATNIDVVGFENGNWTTQLDKRPAIDFKVNHLSGGKSSGAGKK